MPWYQVEKLRHKIHNHVQRSAMPADERQEFLDKLTTLKGRTAMMELYDDFKWRNELFNDYIVTVRDKVEYALAKMYCAHNKMDFDVEFEPALAVVKSEVAKIPAHRIDAFYDGVALTTPEWRVFRKEFRAKSILS